MRSRLKLTSTAARRGAEGGTEGEGEGKGRGSIGKHSFLPPRGGYLLKIESITMSETSHAKVRSRLNFLLDYCEERTTHRDFFTSGLTAHGCVLIARFPEYRIELIKF